MNRLLAKGAEAVIYKENNEVIKIRKPKKYRLKALDERIREKRTKREAKATHDARKAGIPTPIILDLEKYKIKFEYIEGEKIKDIFSRLSQKQTKKIGENVGKLHKINMFHGDLTTSNMIAKKDKIYLIDFGLAGYDEHIEPKGVDLHVLFQTIRSSHPESKGKINQILDEYKKTYPEHEKVIQRLKEIEKRGRYF